MRATIARFDGREIDGARSTGSGVFAAFDWTDMLYGAPGEPISRKAACASRQLSAFDQSDRQALTRVLGHYSDVQSGNSEDTVTWSVFAGAGSGEWISAVLDQAFGKAARPSQWTMEFWKRTPHPDTGELGLGPEADVIISAPGWFYVVEAKWCADLDGRQGRARKTTQLQMRDVQARSSEAEAQRRGVLVIAPGPGGYRPLQRRSTVFSTYFTPSEGAYKPTEAAAALGAACITWESVETILRNHDQQERAAYLRWRLDMLPIRRWPRPQQSGSYPCSGGG